MIERLSAVVLVLFMSLGVSHAQASLLAGSGASVAPASSVSTDSKPPRLAYTLCGETITVGAGHGIAGPNLNRDIVVYEGLTCWLYNHFYLN